MARTRLCWCVLATALLATAGRGGAITNPADGQQHQQTQGPQWSGQQMHWSGQQTQGPQLSGQSGIQEQYQQHQLQQQQQQQQTQGPQWSGQQMQWSGQQMQWSGQQTQGPQLSGQSGIQEQEKQQQQGSAIEHEWGGRPSTPWAWDPVPAGGQAKQPVVQGPATAPPPPYADLESVLSDPQLQWPITVLVDTDQTAIYHARQHWDIVRDDAVAAGRHFYLVTFNDTQVSAVRRVGGVAGLRRALEAERETNGKAHGAAFVALLRAMQAAPRRSALLLFTGRPSADESYGPLAATDLVNAQTRLFVWWSGSRRFEGSGAERLYREAAEHTGGAFFEDPVTALEITARPPGATARPPGATDPLGAEQEKRPAHAGAWQQQERSPVILTARQDLYGTTTTPVLVDTTVEELHIIVLGHVSYATIRSPSGAVIDLLRDGDGAEAADGMLERRLDTRTQRPGLWQLTVAGGRGGSTGTGAAYDVIVKGTSGLRVGLLRPGAAGAPYATWDEDGDLVVTIHGGPRTNVTGLVFLDNKGNELRKTDYKQRVRRDEQNRDIIELAVPRKELLQLQQQESMPHEFYVRVNGYNGSPTNEAFTRVTPRIPNTGNIIVTLNAASNLTIQPGMQNHIYLDVINNGSRPSRIYVYGSSSKNSLYGIVPNSFQLNPNQRRTVNLKLYSLANINGEGDVIKIQVHSELSIAELFLQTNVADFINDYRDTTKPSLKYKIINNCKGIQSCSSKQWSMEATIEDVGSGIRDVTSVPQGIVWSPMVIGTKMPVTIKYRSSCCDESVIVTVSDLQHNTARYTINVNKESSDLSPGAIAGIVVGAVVLLLIIIAVIVFLCRRNKTTHTFQTQQVAR